MKQPSQREAAWGPRSLTVLQGERGAVHRLALGRGSALGGGGGAGAGDAAAAEAGAQLQAPHVADDSRGVEGLLQRQAGGQAPAGGLTSVRRRSPSICFWQSFCASGG